MSTSSIHMLSELNQTEITGQGQRPRHGGDIQEFCKKYGFDAKQCIDLSTGIAPWAWPAPEIPQDVWQKLPSSTCLESDLLQSAAAYYGCRTEHLLAVSGSQSAIEQLPAITTPSAQIAFPYPGYEEHRFAWETAGRKVHAYKNIEELHLLLENVDIDHAVVINPNNPSTEILAGEELEKIRRILANRGGFLIVDEAFADACPEISQISQPGKTGLIILRSVGKFFGLAGLRLGFVSAPTNILERLEPQLGLWPVHSAALWLGARLLADTTWIGEQQQRVQHYSEKLLSLLEQKCPALDWKKSELFASGIGGADQVTEFVEKLAAKGINSRQFQLGGGHALLRVGLTDDAGLTRIEGI